MKRLVALAAVLLLLVLPARAETGDGITRILVIGDALGGGLGAGLLRLTQDKPGYEVSLRFNEESGLARPEVYDWTATVPKILEGNAYDVIVVMLGANDRQVIREGDTRYAFESEGWDGAYARQVDRLLDTLEASDARIIWVSLPPMQDSGYDEAVRAITALQRGRVEARGLGFLDLRPQLSGPDGRYAETLIDGSGTAIRLRGRDGVSFFKAGNNFMASLVLAAIAAAAPAEAIVTAPLDSPSGSSPDSPAPLGGVPLFGQAVPGGPPYTVQPEGVTANAMLLAQAGLTPDAALRTLRDISPSGSGADRLFRLGAPAPAPAGRADDFTTPPPPAP